MLTPKAGDITLIPTLITIAGARHGEDEAMGEDATALMAVEEEAGAPALTDGCRRPRADSYERSLSLC